MPSRGVVDLSSLLAESRDPAVSVESVALLASVTLEESIIHNSQEATLATSTRQGLICEKRDWGLIIEARRAEVRGQKRDGVLGEGQPAPLQRAKDSGERCKLPFVGSRQSPAC